MFGLTFLFRISLPTVVPLAKMDLMLLLCLKLLCQIVMHFDLSSGKQKYSEFVLPLFLCTSSVLYYMLFIFVKKLMHLKVDQNYKENYKDLWHQIDITVKI
jgi:hypothetical protein